MIMAKVLQFVNKLSLLDVNAHYVISRKLIDLVLGNSNYISFVKYNPFRKYTKHK